MRETFFSAAIAGLIAAIALTILQVAWVTPLILQAETYEQPAEEQHLPDHGHASGAVHEHHHSAEEWQPQDGWQRTLFTFVANLLMGFGYAFVLLAVYLLWRQPPNVLYGAIYGIGGFIVFFLAPAQGLPPELPGTAAAELIVRQYWWALVAAATAAGLLLMFARAGWWLRALGAALFVAPHFVAAPHPAVQSSLAPEPLQQQFQVAATVSNAIFWVLLGLVSSLAFRKMLAEKMLAARDA